MLKAKSIISKIFFIIILQKIKILILKPQCDNVDTVIILFVHTSFL
jgi:hypothetical protein